MACIQEAEVMSESERLRMVIKAYRTFFRSIVFRGLPDMAEKIAGPAAFVDEAEIVMEGAELAISHLLRALHGLVHIPEGDILDKLHIYEECHGAIAKLVDGHAPLFRIRREGNRAILEADECPHGGEPKPNIMAVYVGIVAGVVRALGGKAYPARSEKSKHYIHEKGVYIVYPVEGECKIVVEKM